MPVWYEATREARESGRLQVLAITQEQHPARCRLFARWKGIDAPILWDPFNLTGSKVVPRFTLVDEHGVVRVPRARVQDLAGFLETVYAKPEGSPPAPAALSQGMSDVLRSRSADPTPLIDALHAPSGEAADPRRDFRLGVAYRMRYDSAHAREGDFTAAIEAWQRALRARPDQYIWRRRLQQYGPLTDKPYPFYGWIREAQAALETRGEAPEVLDTALTLSERSLSVVKGDASPIDASPDPKGFLSRDEEDALRIEAALVFDTRGQSRTARLHVEVHLRDAEASAWHGGTDPVIVWVKAPAGGSVAPPGLARSLPEEARQEALRFEFDVTLPEAAAGEVQRPEQELDGYVLAPLCRAADGTCVYVRRDWKVRLRP